MSLQFTDPPPLTHVPLSSILPVKEEPQSPAENKTVLGVVYTKPVNNDAEPQVKNEVKWPKDVVTDNNNVSDTDPDITYPSLASIFDRPKQVTTDSPNNHSASTSSASRKQSTDRLNDNGISSGNGDMHSLLSNGRSGLTPIGAGRGKGEASRRNSTASTTSSGGGGKKRKKRSRCCHLI